MLSPTEKGIYIDLLSFYYSVERPITKEECRRIARAYADEDAQAMQYVLQTHFIDDGEVYRHEKCEKVIADAKALIEKKRKASQARWNKARSESRTNFVEQNSFNKDSLEYSDEDARAYADEDASGNANGMLTINHKPITKNIYNPNKEQTEICNEEPACESGVSFEDSIYEQADALALNQTTEVVSDPDAVVNPIQVMGLARMHGIKGQRDHELNELCAKGILTVDNTRQCIRITKKSQKGWRYLVGVMKNAVYEPSQYHTDEYIRREREAFEARIDENKVFE